MCSVFLHTDQNLCRKSIFNAQHNIALVLVLASEWFQKLRHRHNSLKHCKRISFRQNITKAICEITLLFWIDLTIFHQIHF